MLTRSGGAALAVASGGRQHLTVCFTAVAPIAFAMVGGACFLGYKLTAERHADIRRQLDERDAVYAESPVAQAATGGAMEAVTPRPNR